MAIFISLFWETPDDKSEQCEIFPTALRNRFIFVEMFFSRIRTEFYLKNKTNDFYPTLGSYIQTKKKRFILTGRSENVFKQLSKNIQTLKWNRD